MTAYCLADTASCNKKLDKVIYVIHVRQRLMVHKGQCFLMDPTIEPKSSEATKWIIETA